METNITQERINWLKHQIDYYGRYHDHKETMAWVATAFYLGGVAYLSVNLSHILQLCYEEVPIVLTVVISLVFLSIKIFLYMQFNRREVADGFVKIFREELTLLLDSATQQPTGEKTEVEHKWAKCVEARLGKVQDKKRLRWIECLSHRCGISEDPYPLLSKYATYLAICSTTALALALVWIQHLNS